MGVAPKGAFPVAQGKAATNQGVSCGTIDASPIRIERMLNTMFANEETIARWEELSTTLVGRRLVKLPGEDRPRYIDAIEELDAARSARSSHLDEVRHVIDYALTTDAYEDVRCTNCRPWTMPHAPLEFIRVAATAEPPPGSTSMCTDCKGRGKVRSRKKDKESKEAYRRISYFERTLGTAALCAKVRSKTSEADDAYATLLANHQSIVVKFGNEMQTAMEGADAEQGARMGILDAAIRFDPTRPECAAFGTVAHNWAYRNSRARKRTDERAGVSAVSLDDPSVFGGKVPDGTTQVDLLASCDGALASFDESTSSDYSLVIDMRSKIADLPEEQQQIVLAIYGGHTVFSAARALKMKRSEVTRIRDEAFAALRDSLSGYVEAVCD